MTLEPQMGLNFEQVWATIQGIAEQHKQLTEQHKQLAEQHEDTERFLKESKAETDRRFQELAEQHKDTERFLKESKAETERFLKESKAETERFLKESKAETERFLKESKSELNGAIGNLSHRLGELVEHLVSPNLLKKFNALGYAFGKSNPRTKYTDVKTGKVLAEVDVQLENGGCVLAVEVKTNPVINDVDDHVNRMEALRAYADVHDDGRDYIGAIAGGIMSESVKNYALRRGFYVLEQSGDTMNIAAVPEAWAPKKW